MIFHTKEVYCRETGLSVVLLRRGKKTTKSEPEAAGTDKKSTYLTSKLKSRVSSKSFYLLLLPRKFWSYNPGPIPPLYLIPSNPIVPPSWVRFSLPGPSSQKKLSLTGIQFAAPLAFPSLDLLLSSPPSSRGFFPHWQE